MTSATETILERWLEHLKEQDHSAHTLRLYRTVVRSFLDWFEAAEHRSFAVDELTPATFTGYRNYLQHEKNKATSTVNAHLAALRSWGEWLSEVYKLSRNPAAKVKSIQKQEVAAPKALSKKEVDALLREAERTRYPQRDYAILQLMLQTGMRVGECAALNYEDIDYGERSGFVIIRAGKGNKTRKVPLNGTARKALADYVAQRLGVEPTIVAVAAAWPKRQPGATPTPLWRSPQGRGDRLSTVAIRRMVDILVKVCAARELVPADASAHTLRHTFATFYLKDHPGDLVGLADLLGHTSVDTTRIYARLSDQERADRVDQLQLNAYE